MGQAKEKARLKSERRPFMKSIGFAIMNIAMITTVVFWGGAVLFLAFIDDFRNHKGLAGDFFSGRIPFWDIFEDRERQQIEMRIKSQIKGL